MGLQIVWFIIIAFFWTGFFVLEGFDFGVGALHTVVGKTDLERRRTRRGAFGVVDRWRNHGAGCGGHERWTYEINATAGVVKGPRR